MKKKNLIGIGMLIGMLVINVYASKNNNSTELTISLLTNIAQASPEGCLNNPSTNKGWCKEDVGGGDWHCVRPPDISIYDCVSDL